jgi:hypothetical protein
MQSLKQQGLEREAFESVWNDLRDEDHRLLVECFIAQIPVTLNEALRPYERRVGPVMLAEWMCDRTS